MSMSVNEVFSVTGSLEDYFQIRYGRLSLNFVWNSQSFLSITKPSLNNVTNGRFHVYHKQLIIVNFYLQYCQQDTVKQLQFSAILTHNEV
jgi:hypothetical protein